MQFRYVRTSRSGDTCTRARLLELCARNVNVESMKQRGKGLRDGEAGRGS